jgi:Transposase DDE domain group 1
MRRFDIVQSETDITTSHSGLALIGQALRQTRLACDLAEIPLRHGIAHADCVTSYVGLLATGKSDFDAIENRRADAFFRCALGLDKVPSAPSLRQRLDELAHTMLPIVDRASIDFLSAVGAEVTPIVVRQGRGLCPAKVRYTPLDIDVTPFDNSRTKKEGVSWTYKGFDGYAPIAAYLGEEGWCLGLELRPGSQHSQAEIGHFLERVLPRAKRLSRHPLLARLDAGNDAAETRAIFDDDGCAFILKWNPRKQDLVKWLERAEKEAVWTSPRAGKRAGIFSETIEEDFRGRTRQFRRIVRVTVRDIDRDGHKLLVPEIALEGWWTSLPEALVDEDQVIALYRAHGTSEQFHSEFKTDLDIERLPSGKFATNDLVLACAVLTYNILRWIGLEGLTGRDAPVRHKAKRRRLRTVMQELMSLAARVVESGRRLGLKFSSHCPAFASFTALYGRLCPS